MPPAGIDLFDVHDDFPLLQEVDKYILEARLKKGDCMFIPSHYWRQIEVESKESTQVTQSFESTSKLVDALINGLKLGVLTDK